MALFRRLGNPGSANTAGCLPFPIVVPTHAATTRTSAAEVVADRCCVPMFFVKGRHIGEEKSCRPLTRLQIDAILKSDLSYLRSGICVAERGREETVSRWHYKKATTCTGKRKWPG